MWAAVTALAIWGAADISLGQWRRYNESPTVVTLEKDFRNWRYTFPALTVCANNKVDAGKAEKAIQRLWNVDKSDERYARYLEFVRAVADAELTHLDAFRDFTDQPDLDVDLYQLAIAVRPDFSLKQAWVESLDPRWLPVMTERGACFTVNSLAVADITIAPLKSPDPTHYPIECKYSSHSCYVTLEVTYCIKVYVHSAYDVIDATDSGVELCPATQRKLELSVLESGCGRGVRQLAVRRRGCLYTDEPLATEPPRKVYSMNLCRRSCRNRLAIQLCGCRPFFNFYDVGTACNATGMACLSRFSHELRTFSKVSEAGRVRYNAPELLLRCACRPQCQDAVYQESSREDQSWVKGPFASRGSARYSLQAPRTRYSREIVFHFQDLVVSFGGAAGLFLGASFLSFVEIVYFVLERSLRPCRRLLRRHFAAPRAYSSPTAVARSHVGLSERSRLQDLATLMESGRLGPQMQNWLPPRDPIKPSSYS